MIIYPFHCTNTRRRGGGGNSNVVLTHSWPVPEVLLRGARKRRKLELTLKTCLSESLGERQVYRGSNRNPGNWRLWPFHLGCTVKPDLKANNCGLFRGGMQTHVNVYKICAFEITRKWWFEIPRGNAFTPTKPWWFGWKETAWCAFSLSPKEIPGHFLCLSSAWLQTEYYGALLCFERAPFSFTPKAHTARQSPHTFPSVKTLLRWVLSSNSLSIWKDHPEPLARSPSLSR